MWYNKTNKQKFGVAARKGFIVSKGFGTLHFAYLDNKIKEFLFLFVRLFLRIYKLPIYKRENMVEKMIKLIVCDVDGTLLPHGEKRISYDIADLIKEAGNKGISFAAASGRAYHELKRLFEGINVWYIPSDGAALVYNEETLFKKNIPLFAADKLVKALTETEKTAAVATGKYMSYIIKGENIDSGFNHKITSVLNGHAVCAENVSEIDEDILKLSFYGEARSVFGKKLLSGTADNLIKVIYKDSLWTDFVSVGAGKKAAVLKLIEHLKLEADETVVIGDGDNDADMLKITKNSVAVKGGSKNAVKAAKYITSNVNETLDFIIRKGEICDVL